MEDGDWREPRDGLTSLSLIHVFALDGVCSSQSRSQWIAWKRSLPADHALRGKLLPGLLPGDGVNA